MGVLLLQNEIVHYEVLGRGKPLLFLHGWIGSWRYWMPSMQSASVLYRTYALDLWGYGDTAKVPMYYSLEKQLELLDLFLQEMGIRRIVLIGHGLGAIVATCFAGRNPNWVDRMLLIGMPQKGPAVNPRLLADGPLELTNWLLSRSPDSGIAGNEVMKMDGRVINVFASTLGEPCLEAVVGDTKIPSLFVFGREDPLIPASDLSQDQTEISENIHQIIFDGSGHFPMLDERSKFNRLLADFLALNSGVSPRQLQLKDEWKRRVR